MVDKAVVCAACARGIGLLDRAVLFVHPVHLVHDRVEPLGEAPLVGIGQLRSADGKAVPAQDVVVLVGDQLVDCGHGGLRPKGGKGRLSRQGGAVPPGQGVNLVQHAVISGHHRAHLRIDAGHLRAGQVGRLVHESILGEYGVVLGVQRVHAGCQVCSLGGSQLGRRSRRIPLVHGTAYGHIGRRCGSGRVCLAAVGCRCRRRRSGLGRAVGALPRPHRVCGNGPGGKRRHEDCSYGRAEYQGAGAPRGAWPRGAR